MHCNHSSQTCSDLPHHFLAKGWFLQKLISHCDTHNREKMHLKHFQMVSLIRGKAFTMWFSDKRRGQKPSRTVDCIIVRNYSLRTFKRIIYPHYCQVTAARKAHPHFLSDLYGPVVHEQMWPMPDGSRHVKSHACFHQLSWSLPSSALKLARAKQAELSERRLVERSHSNGLIASNTKPDLEMNACCKPLYFGNCSLPQQG